MRIHPACWGVILALAPDLRGAQHPFPDSTRALLRRGDLAGALEFAGGLARKHADDAWAHHAWAMALTQADSNDHAIRAAERAVRLDSHSSHQHMILGNALLAKANRHGGLGSLGTAKRGRAALERALELDAGNLRARETLIEFHLGAPGVAGGSKDEARRHATEIGRRDTTLGRVWLLRVVARTGPERELLPLFEQALSQVGTPGDSGGAILGSVIAALVSAQADAWQERLLDHVLAREPTSPLWGYYRARRWLVKNREPARAEALLRDYLTATRPSDAWPSEAATRWRLGQALEHQGKAAEAAAEYRRALELQPSLTAARSDLQRLEASQRPASRP